MHVEREHHDLDVGHLRVLEHRELLLELRLEPRRERARRETRGEALLECGDERVRARGEVLQWDEGHAAAHEAVLDLGVVAARKKWEGGQYLGKRGREGTH